MADPVDIGDDEAVERVALDLPVADADFFQRFAAYRNALAKAQDKTLKRKWTRKSFLESMLITEAARLRAQLVEMIEANGPLPEHKDVEAMERYAKRVMAWDKKNGGK